MKNLYYFMIGILLTTSFNSTAQDAQIQGKVDDELPVVGVRYYFYPNLDAYFDTQKNLYIYQEQGQWVRTEKMDPGYRGYSLLNGAHVDITDYNGDQPYSLLKEHQQKFPKKYSSKRRPPLVIKEEPTIASR